MKIYLAGGFHSGWQDDIKWIREIVAAADKAKIPVFLKNNLNSCEISDYPELLDSKGNLRQELPIE